MNGIKHARFNKEEIYELRKEETSKIYWQRKDAITDQAWKDINWQASKVALKDMPRGSRRFHAKHASRHCAVGKMMKLRKQWTHSMCPQCGIPEETTVHVSQCPAEKSQAVWEVSMAKLQEDLVALDTEPALLQQLMSHLRAWHSGAQLPAPPFRRKLAQALMAQGGIGWHNFLLGRVARQFETLQQTALHRQGLQTNRQKVDH